METNAQFRHIRIIYLPPATVAAARSMEPEPEMQAYKAIDEFVQKAELYRIKPDFRHYGFNTPDEKEKHGYEVWVTIPDDCDVPSPLCKKYSEGGLYAAYMIPMGSFDEYDVMNKWIENNGTYVMNSNGKGSECMFGILEEHLNYFNHIQLGNTQPDDMQLDLLFPIRKK